MRKAYVMMIGGTLVIAVVLGGIGTMVSPSRPVSPVSAKDAATASSGSASQQAAALEAAEAEARENPPPPAIGTVADDASVPDQPVATSSYQGTAPTPSLQFGGSQSDSAAADTPPPEPVVVEE